MNLTLRRLLGSVILIILLFIGLSWTIQKQLSVKVRAELGETLQTVLNAAHHTLVTWLDVHKSATLAWANSFTVIDAVSALLDKTSAGDTRETGNPAARLTAWFHSIASSSSYRAFLIAAPGNTILVSSKPLESDWQKLVRQQPGFIDKIWSGKAVVSSPLLSDANTPVKACQFVGAPIYGVHKKIVAVLVFQFAPDKDFNQILQLGHLGASGETYLFNDQGTMVSQSRYVRQLQNIGLLKPGESSILKVPIRDPGTNLLKHKIIPPLMDWPFTTMAASAIHGKSDMNLTGYRDYRGVKVVGAWLWDSEYGIGIATEQEANEAFRMLRESLFIISTLTVLAIAMLLGLARLYAENHRRRNAEQALRTSRERFEAQFRGVPVPTYTWQRQGDDFRLVDYNIAADLWTNGGVAALTGSTASQLYKEHRPDILDDLHNCFAKKTNIHKNYWYTLLSTGSPCYMDVTYAYIPEDLVLIHTNNITEQKRAEDSLHQAHNVLEQRVSQRTLELEKANIELTQEINRRRQAEQALRDERDKAQYCIDNVSAIIVGIDKSGNVTLINQPACKLLEKSEEELIGKNWFEECLPASEKQEVYKIFKQVMEGKLDGAEYYENNVISRSGRQKLIAWKNSYLKDNLGNIAGSLSVGEDITARRRSEEMVRARQAELTHFARVTSMGEMATGIAHELNQPLTAINIYAGSCLQQLRASDQDKEKLQYALERISQQAQRAANIIQNLRQFLSKGASQCTPTDLNRLILQTGEIATIDVKKAQMKIHYDLLEHLPLVNIDPIQIEQVVINLIRNSLDALSNTPKGERHLIIETALSNDREAQVSVSDNGTGIKNGEMEKLFHTFYSNKPGGMGMGLAISRTIIEAHEGRLFAYNNPEGGATFTFTLPI